MAAAGPSNILARRVTDDLIDFSARLNALIAEIESMGDVDDVFDTLMCLRDDIRDENTKLLDLNDVIAQAEDKIATDEIRDKNTHTSFAHYNLDLAVEDPGEVESLWIGHW
ncbi:hypothetical protein Tco_1477898 [Tanacetum coccineum]